MKSFCRDVIILLALAIGNRNSQYMMYEVVGVVDYYRNYNIRGALLYSYVFIFFYRFIYKQENKY